MAYVTLTNITVLNNPTAFSNPFQFEVTFECAHQLEDDLEWKITYVGSAENETQDQVLEEVLVGPVPVGTNKFVFQSDPPKPDLIPDEDKLGVTVVLITCSYRGNEFVRVGYYVNNEYADPLLAENPPASVDITKLQRNILADKPRVTRFPIEWSNDGTAKEEDMAMDGANPTSVGESSMGTGMDQDGGNDLYLNYVDDEELMKAAAQLDSNYQDIVIGQGVENDSAEDDEEDEEDNNSAEEAEEDLTVEEPRADKDMEMEVDNDL